MIQYALLFGASLAFEASYTAWAMMANRGRPWVTAGLAIATAAFSLLGLKGALELELGWVPYLAGIGLGAWITAYLGRAEAELGPIQ